MVIERIELASTVNCAANAVIPRRKSAMRGGRLISPHCDVECALSRFRCR
jgi:hypothetical protein